MPELQLSVQDLERRREVQVDKRVISWFGVQEAPLGGIGYSGQDESCLKYLHLPDNLDDVNFDLNLSHPDDDYKLQSYSQSENISNLLSWVKDCGSQDDG